MILGKATTPKIFRHFKAEVYAIPLGPQTLFAGLSKGGIADFFVAKYCTYNIAFLHLMQLEAWCNALPDYAIASIHVSRV